MMSEATSELLPQGKLIGIETRLIKRINPIPNPKVGNIEKDYDTDQSKLKIEWEHASGFNGGCIEYKFVGSIDERGIPRGILPNIVLTSYRVYPVGSSLTYHPNPRESLAATLTMIATLNGAAILSAGDLLHIARANPASRPYFERFVSSGLYSYCDRQGNTVANPINLPSSESTVFASHYPLATSSELLGALDKFVIAGAAEKLANERKKLLSDST